MRQLGHECRDPLQRAHGRGRHVVHQRELVHGGAVEEPRPLGRDERRGPVCERLREPRGDVDRSRGLVGRPCGADRDHRWIRRERAERDPVVDGLTLGIFVLAREHADDVGPEHAVQVRHLRRPPHAVAARHVAVARRAIRRLPRGRVAELHLLQLATDARALERGRDRDRHRVHRVLLAQHRVVVRSLDVGALLERRSDREGHELRRPAAGRDGLADDERALGILDRGADLGRRGPPRRLVHLVLDIEDRREEAHRLVVRHGAVHDLGRRGRERRGLHGRVFPHRGLRALVGIEP